MNARGQLVNLLLELFESVQLHQLVHDVAYDLRTDLPNPGATAVAPRDFAFRVVSALDRRRLIDERFFTLVREARPGRADEIEAVMRLFVPAEAEELVAGSPSRMALEGSAGLLAGAGLLSMTIAPVLMSLMPTSDGFILPLTGVLWLLAGGLILLAGIGGAVAAVPKARQPWHAWRWAHAWQVARHGARRFTTGAHGRTHLLRLAAWSSALLVSWLLYFPDLSSFPAEDREVLALQAALALGLGVGSIALASIPHWPARIAMAAVAATAWIVLPNVESVHGLWSEEPAPVLLAALLTPHDLHHPMPWVLAAPALTPISIHGALGLALVLVRSTPGAWWRATGGFILAGAFAAALALACAALMGAG